MWAQIADRSVLDRQRVLLLRAVDRTVMPSSAEIAILVAMVSEPTGRARKFAIDLLSHFWRGDRAGAEFLAAVMVASLSGKSLGLANMLAMALGRMNVGTPAVIAALRLVRRRAPGPARFSATRALLSLGWTRKWDAHPDRGWQWFPPLSARDLDG